MRHFLILIAAWLLTACATPSDAGVKLHLHGGVTTTTCAQDGSSGAPAGTTIMYAARKATWAFPPACQTPDVDYGVGPVNDCAACVDPSTATLPTGVTWNNTAKRVDCSGAPDGTIIENLDFTKISGGGGGFLIGASAACNNVTIRNVKMQQDCTTNPASYPIRQQTNSTGITVTQVWIDGGSLKGAICNLGELIYLSGSGLQKVTYSRLVNFEEHDITFACTSPCTSYARYNSVSRSGWSQGSHVNGVQWLGTFSASDVSYNYYYNPQPDTALEAAAGMTIDTTSGSTSSTLHFTGSPTPITQTAILNGMTITSANLQSGSLVANSPAPTNPTSATLSKTATGTASGTSAAIPNAYPFGLANAIRYANQGAVTGQMTNGTFTGNVFDGNGPIIGGTNAFSCGGDSTGNEINGMVITGNYFNGAGYAGAGTDGGFFLKAAFCIGVSGSGNKSLVTGATLTNPS